MEKLQKVYDIFVRDGHISDPAKTPFDKWAASFSDKPERQGELYDFLAEKKYVKQKPKDVWLGEAFGGATPTVVDQKKKTTPDQGVGSPVSQPQSKTASVVTPQSKPTVSPAKPTYLYGQEKEVVAPAAGENTPVPGLGGAPMEVKTTTVVEPLPPLQKEQEQATGMKEMFQKFQDYRNQATIAAQKNTMDEAAGNIEYKKSQRDPNPDWAEQQKYALEDAQAAERAKVVATQPLVSKMLDYYVAKAGDTEWEDNRLVKALSYTSPPAALLAGGPGGMFAGDRDDSPVVALKEQLVGTPEGAALEQELQKIYKRTNLKDQTSVDNALLDAKQLMFEKLADKDVAIWDDFAQTNKAMADYNPTAYHARTRGKMEQKYAAAGIDKSMIDSKLMDYSLGRGVMDEERTAEAKAVLNLRNIRDEVSRAEREGSAFRIDQAKQKLAAAEKEVQAMESKRLSSLDAKIEEIQNAIVAETDPKKIEIYKKGLNLVKAQRAGFINPNSQVMTAYAKFQDQADAVAPKGTPMEKLQKLYAELEFDRQEIMGRIQQAEAKGGAIGFAANEMLNSLPGNSHNDDHKLLLRTEAQLKDLAPIVFLNENPAVQDKKSGFWKYANTAFLTTLAGDGSIYSNTQKQEDAINLYRNLQVAGVSPEVLNDPTMMGIKDRMDNPGLDSWEFWGDITGSSTGIMLPLIVTTAATRGIGLSSAIGRIVQVGNRALGLSGKYTGAILPLLGDAIESGINYEAAGRYVSVHNDKELDFLGGLLGGAASSFGSGAFTSAKKVVTRMFGDKAQDAANMFVNFGASRLGAGTGELSEEFGQQVGQLWESSSTGQEFWKRMEEQFGTFDEASKFVVSTMVLGMAMGGAHSGGFGEYLHELNQKKLNELPPEERARVQPVIDQLQDEQLALVEGGLNATPEDVASVEAEQEGIEPEKKKELKPEAQAAQAELERRAAIDKTMVEQGLGDRVNTAQSQEDRLREERDALVAQQERQELTTNEKKKLADLETVVAGLDQIAAGEQFVSPAPVAETETITTESGATIEPVEGSPTRKKITLDDGTEFEADMDMEELLKSLNSEETIALMNEAFSPPTEETVAEGTPAQPAMEENPFGDPTPREQPKRRDQQIVEQIEEFFNGLAGAVSEGSKNKLKEYANRILKGEDPKVVLQGQTLEAVKLVNQAVTAIQNESAPATDESIMDVTGEAPTPISAEETVVAESPAPKGKAAKGGKSKPKANPNRKTKAKPVADLTPTEVVSEAIALSAEPQTAETKAKEAEIEARIENAADESSQEEKSTDDIRTLKEQQDAQLESRTVGFAQGMKKIMDEAFEQQRPFRDAFLKRIGKTFEQFKSLPENERQKLQDQWVKSPEFMEMRGETPITPEEQVISQELNITEDETRGAKKGTKARTRKSTAVVEAIEIQAEAAITSGDAEAAAETIAAIEVAENAILSGVEPSNDFQGNHGVSEVDLANEYNSLGKNASLEQAYKNVTGKELVGTNRGATEEEVAEYKQFATDFINAVSRAGIKLKKPLEFKEDLVIDLMPIPARTSKKTGVDSINNNVSVDETKESITGVHFDGDQMVATDGFRVIIIKMKESADAIIEKFKAAIVKAKSKKMGLKAAQAEADRVAASLREEGLDGKTLNFNGGEVVEKRFPDYNVVIPKEDSAQTKSIPIQQLIDIVNGAAVSLKNLAIPSSQRVAFVMRFGGEIDLDIGMNPVLMLEALQTLQENGATSVVLGVTKANRAVNLYADNGNRGIVMPVMLSTEETGRYGESLAITKPYELNTVAPKDQTAPKKEAAKTESKPATTPKEKAKARGKQPFDEGVEDQFIVANIRGTRTVYRKKDGVWESREHKGKISDNKFRNEWTPVEDEDIAFAERMAAKDPLTLDAINAATEWVAEWKNFVTLRWGGDGKMFTGEMFSRPDLGLMKPVAEITLATFKMGKAVAKVLIKNGNLTRKRWEEAMLKYVGEHIRPLLNEAWENMQDSLDSMRRDVLNPDSESTEDQPNEKTEDIKKKSGRQATADTMREFSGTNPAALNAALAAVDDTYEVMSIKGIFAEALAAVKKAGGFANPDVWADLLTEKEGEDKVLHHAKRMLAIRFYGELADQIQERMGDEATQEEMDAFEKAVARMEVALDLVKNNNTWSGQQTSMMAEWRMVMANTVGYARAKIEKYNADLLKSPKKGKAIRRKAKEAKEQLNDIREQDGATLDASAPLDTAITDVENGTVPKTRKKREGGKPKTVMSKALGMTRAQADAMMEQAAADMRRAAREGFAGSTGSPAVFDFANALGRYGVAVMAKGAITFKEWASKIKGDFPNVTDQQLQTAWDTHEHDGKTIAEHSKEALAAAAAAPVKRTEARKQSLRGKIRGAINDHFKKGAEPMTLEERLLAIKDEAGNQLLTEDEAAHIYDTVKDEFEARVKAKVEARAKALKRKPKKESKPAKTDSQRAIEAMVDGEFTDEMVQEIFADRLGLIQQMTTEQMKTARALGKALDSTKPNTRSEAQAAMALDQFMYEILPPPSNGELFGELFKSIIYANMLMGIPTHLKNLITSGAMTVSSFVETLGNLPKWKRAVRLAIKKGKETGDWKEASWLFLQASPFTELAVKTRALARGWSKGARIAWDIMKSGYIDSKYIDQGKAKLGRLSPILERHRFGKYNPSNIFKYVGRALSAEDAWMYAINNEMELADATRRHFLDGKAGGLFTLTKDVSRRMAKSNPLYATSLTEAEADIDKISDALQMTPAEKARAIKIRAREILIDKIGLTEDEVQQAEDVARSRIFTMKRNGLWGKTATLMTKINNTKGIGKVSWIWMPFANIIGNLGDTFNDSTPLYGLLRANGISPTGIAQMLGMTKESAMMSEPVQAEGTMDWIKKTWGGRQDQRYYEQMGRAWLGSMMMLAAMMLMDDDDKDDFIQFTGKNDPTHKNYLKIGGVPIISWELIPSIAPVAAIMSEAHSYHKLHPKEERSFGRRMLYAMGAVEQSVAGLSVAESVQNLNQVVGTALSSLTGVGNYGDPVDFEKGITTLGTELGKSGIGMLSRVNPLTNPLVGQIQQIFDPRVFSHSTIEQSMEYAALGATYRYTKDAEGNDRIAGVDIFGEEIKRLPSEDSFGFLSMFANEKAKDPRWKFLADHGGLEVMSRTTNANILFEDDEEKYGVVSRKMTDKQYGTYAKLAGQKFSKELTKYMNGNQWKKDYETVVMGTAGTMTKLQEEVKKMASEARTKAKNEMDRMPESKGGFGGTRIGTKTYVKP